MFLDFFAKRRWGEGLAHSKNCLNRINWCIQIARGGGGLSITFFQTKNSFFFLTIPQREVILRRRKKQNLVIEIHKREGGRRFTILWFLSENYVFFRGWLPIAFEICCFLIQGIFGLLIWIINIQPCPGSEGCLEVRVGIDWEEVKQMHFFPKGPYFRARVPIGTFLTF